MPMRIHSRPARTSNGRLSLRATMVALPTGDLPPILSLLYRWRIRPPSAIVGCIREER